MKEINTCPFCGNDDPWLHEWIFGAKVICRECKANGPEFTDGGSLGVNAKGAWNLWNSRVNQSLAIEAKLREEIAELRSRPPTREINVNGPSRENYHDDPVVRCFWDACYTGWEEMARALYKANEEVRAMVESLEKEAELHASSATILGFECQKLQNEIKTLNEEINNLCARLSAFTDL